MQCGKSFVFRELVGLLHPRDWKIVTDVSSRSGGLFCLLYPENVPVASHRDCQSTRCHMVEESNQKQHGRENLKCRILCADLVMFYYSFKETYSWDGYTSTVPEGRSKTVQQYRRIASLASRKYKAVFFPPGGERASTRRNVSATRRFALQCLVDMIRYADSLAGVRCR